MRAILLASALTFLAATGPLWGQDAPVPVGAINRLIVAVGDITATQLWARATPKGATVGGAYLSITNGGKEADRLVKVTFAGSDHATLHEMATENGVMTMRALPDGLEIPAGGTVTLAPGGYHLMLEGLKAQLKQGDPISLELTFAKAGTVVMNGVVAGLGAKTAP